MSLATYKAKRKFTQTPEPSGKLHRSGNQLRFVVQKHQARRLHYDFRLELDGALKSWAVPKGPPESAGDKRLAVLVEDHPVSYLTFSGRIPEGNYGAGTVEIWDHGFYEPIDESGKPVSQRQALTNLKAGELKVALNGQVLNGEYVLVRMKDEKNWLFLKHDLRNRHHQKQIVRPMLASLHTGLPFNDADWLFEIKWDGYRAIADHTADSLLFYSRNGLVFTDYPLLWQALEKKKGSYLVDGEIVVLDKNGHPSFQLLQQYKEDQAHPLVFYAFDMLEWNGEDLREKPLSERKRMLKSWVDLQPDSSVRFSDHVIGCGSDLFEEVKRIGLEGIMAKKKNSRYADGFRSRQWLKIKNVTTTEAVIIGYTRPTGTRKHFGSLLLAEYVDRHLQFIGHVGTGFNERDLETLKKTMDLRKTSASPLKSKVKVNAPVTWLRPEMVCTVKFSERTREGSLRHPVFLGLRPDKDADEAKKDNDLPMKGKDEKMVSIDGFDVRLSHVSKVYWPDEEITKGDMLGYYLKIAPILLPYLKERPLSLNRTPNGIKSKGFYHKDAGENVPEFVTTEVVKSDSSEKEIDYIVCNNTATLLYVANLGSIEMNPWNSTRKKPNHPSYVVIDIDPSDKNTFDEVILVALTAKAILDKAGVSSFPKTSGATGMHVYIPMGNKYPYEQAKDFAQVIALMIQESLPSITTVERLVKKRGDKIYVDYLQNARGQTLASAYSIRPVPGAQVSAPLEWKEVKPGLSPNQFTLFNMPERVKKKGDLFLPVLAKGIDMKKSLRNLEAS